MRAILISLLCWFVLMRTDAGAATGHLRYGIIDRIPGPDGGYDYVSIDTSMQRVFVARDSGVFAVDLATHNVIPSLLAAQEVASVLLLPHSAVGMITERGRDRAVFFDRTSGKVIAQAPTGKGPDGATFDPHSGRVFVLNSDSDDVTAISASKYSVAGTLALGGEPEAAVADGKGMLYLNVLDRSEIAVVDTDALKVVRRFPLPGCVQPTGLAFDPQTQVLISSCQNGVTQLTYAPTGGELGQVPIGRRPDGAIFDVKRRLAYIPCVDGTLTVFKLTDEGLADDVTVSLTQEGARTIALDEETGRLYMPSVHSVWGTDGKRHRFPGTFAVLVVGPLADAG